MLVSNRELCNLLHLMTTELAVIIIKIGFIRAVEESGNAESVDHPLHDASKRGNLPFLRECLANGVSPNALDKVRLQPNI